MHHTWYRCNALRHNTWCRASLIATLSYPQTPLFPLISTAVSSPTPTSPTPTSHAQRQQQHPLCRASLLATPGHPQAPLFLLSSCLLSNAHPSCAGPAAAHALPRIAPRLTRPPTSPPFPPSCKLPLCYAQGQQQHTLCRASLLATPGHPQAPLFLLLANTLYSMHRVSSSTRSAAHRSSPTPATHKPLSSYLMPTSS